MRVLTESMTRLRDEILALRHNRQTFRRELERSTKEAQVRVSALRRTIANDLAGARCAWLGTISGAHRNAGAEACRPWQVEAARGAHGVVLEPPLEHHREVKLYKKHKKR